MNKTHLFLAAAMAGIISAGVAADASADDKCYGIAKAGQNSCANALGTHSCKGMAKTDNDPGDWVSIAADDCVKQGGKTEAPSK